MKFEFKFNPNRFWHKVWYITYHILQIAVILGLIYVLNIK